MGHAVYFHRIVPAIGALISDRDAYRYLPDSAAYLPDEPRLRAMIATAGFTDIAKRRLGGGAGRVCGNAGSREDGYAEKVCEGARRGVAE